MTAGLGNYTTECQVLQLHGLTVISMKGMTDASEIPKRD